MSTFTDLMQTILTAIENRLTEPVKRAQITPGTPAWDDCCGQLSLWLTSTQPNGQRAGCPPVSITYTFAVQVVRCVATQDNNGRPPSERQITEDGLTFVLDMEEMKTAILCDLPSGLSVELGQWLQNDPMGGCAGGQWSFSITMAA